MGPGDTVRAAHWTASQVSLSDPQSGAQLLRELREAGAADATRSLASRAPSQASLSDSHAVGARPGELSMPGPMPPLQTCWLETPPATSASTTQRPSPSC